MSGTARRRAQRRRVATAGQRALQQGGSAGLGGKSRRRRRAHSKRAQADNRSADITGPRFDDTKASTERQMRDQFSTAVFF